MHCTINHYAKRYPPNPTTWIVRDCCWSICSSTFDIRRIWCSLTYLRLSEPPRALEIRLPCFLTLLSIFLETLGEGVVGMTYILTNKEINEIVVIISRCQSPIANRVLAVSDGCALDTGRTVHWGLGNEAHAITITYETLSGTLTSEWKNA